MSMGAASSALQPDELTALAAPPAYTRVDGARDASAAAGIARVETHLSQVFLTGERVYKFRRAVDLGFVSFASRDERNADCLREVALNRRLAPDVYLGVAPLLGAGTEACVGPVGESLAGGSPTPEHCVVMRRLPAGRDALSLLDRGALDGTQIDRVAARIARFHDDVGLGTPAPFAAEDWWHRCTAPVEDNLRILHEADPSLAPPEALGRLNASTTAEARQCAERFEQRRRRGLAVEAHGDLHLQHVWFEHDGDAPLFIDCLEFNDALRRIDAASEVAFLAMDLRYRGRPDFAERFLRTYAALRDDFDLYGVVGYFASYRAAVRAKVASIAAADASIDAAQRRAAAESARRHLALAQDLLASGSDGALVLVGGAVGTGKSSVAAALADELRGVVISSDRVRKHMLDLTPTERVHPSCYTAAHKERVYAGLLSRAAPVVDSGRIAVLDATFGARLERERALAWAGARRVPAWFLQTRCAPGEAMARLERRAAAGRDTSDAGPELHSRSLAAFEAPREWPAEASFAIDTDTDWHEPLARLAERLRGLLPPADPCTPCFEVEGGLR